ncbi:unnamed protein product [Cuscuta epithymum]|uniref:4-coumarate--CoA ligase n=1 Tax=Cuscuta epithymum TaxID=186058 RepID=A0AAV0G1J0_9ASTE|nr:unnamed protein product [Cuscuta epithymum]
MLKLRPLMQMANYSKAHICQCMSRVSASRRSSTVTISGDRRKTGAQFVDGILSLARGLRQLGLQPGDVVAISALNSDLYLEWLLAVAYAGGITAPLNYRWSLEEASEAVKVARPTLLVTDSALNSWHSKFDIDSISSLRWHVSIDIPFGVESTWNGLTTKKLKNCHKISLETNYMWAPEGAAIICFTSGTTGKPKGVTLSHSALIVQSLAKIAIVGYREDDVYLHMAPLCHIGGMSSAMAVLMAGGCHILIPKFNAGLAVESIHQYAVTSLITVPAMMTDLVSFYSRKGESEGSPTVKKILNGGGALSVELINHAAKIFPRAKLISAYGMTEACSSMTFKTLYDPAKESVRRALQLNNDRDSNLARQQEGICVGKPAPHVELRVCAESSSRNGRILTRGSHVMLGYWGQISNKTSKLAGENWLDTGDIGHIDDHGNIWLIGRSKGRIKSGGENVYPEEVEAVLSQHPGVSGNVVVGLPDLRLGEMVVSCIQLKCNWQWDDLSSSPPSVNYLSADILRCFCKEKQLTRFKVPKRFIRWRNQFPVTTTGKIKRDLVRAELMSNMQSMSSKL